ncbi:putative annexin A4 [Apostichopus japonicus]|uniref:Annexin n=1 Tax=Stichopus japonicus TaxID=307972 RepID=A0A2G8L6C7_STIJA|nr:putative annexin A4 [Apostichopus japonicus]
MAAPKPTVVPLPGFDKDSDAAVLRKAMKGLGTDEKAIINVLVCRSNNQRQEIAAHFKTAYGKGVGTDESTLLEILCARNNAQIKAIKDAYKKTYHNDLESDLQSETSGYLKRTLTGLVQGNRDESMAVDAAKAKNDAQTLYEAGEKKLGTDESEFQRILVTRSWLQMRAIFDEYGKIAGRSIEESIKREMSGDLERAYLNIVKFARSPPEYFAEVLHKAMKGAGTDEDRLTRTLITRSEIDLGDIKEAYQAKYEKPLAKAVESEVSGDFKKLLLGLIK